MTVMQPVWPLTRRPERPGTAVAGHRGRINAARFSVDGGVVVSGDQSGTTLVSDVRTGRVVHTLEPAALFCPVVAVATGPRHRVAIGRADGTVRVVEIDGEVREVAELVHDGFREVVEDLSFLADGACLLIRHRDRIRVRNLDRGTVLVDVTPDDAYWGGPPWTVSGDLLAVGDGDTVRTWPFEDAQQGQVLRGHTAPVLDLDVLPGLLVSTDAVGIVRVWDAPSGRPVAAFLGSGRPAVDDRTGLLVVPTTSGARVVDPRHGDLDGEVARYARRARRLDRAADRLLALADRLPVGADALRDRAEALDPAVHGRRGCAGPGLGWAMVVGTEEELDGNLVLTSHTLTFLDRDGHPRDTVRLSGRCAGVVAMDRPDRCATLSDNGLLYVWSAAGDAVSTTDVVPDGRIATVAAAPDRRRIAVGDDDGDLRLVDLTATPPAEEPYEPRAERAGELVVDPEGGWAATAMAGRAIGVWNLADGSLRHVFRGHVTGVFRSSESNRVAHGRDEHGPWLAHADDDGTLRVRDPAAGTRIAIGSGEGGEFLGAAGSSGLAVAERDGRVRLREPRTGRVGAELVGHAEPVRDLTATTTGLIVTIAADGVRVWDVTRPAPRYAPIVTTPTGSGVHVQVDPHGRWFAVTGFRSVRLYETSGTLITELDLPGPTTAAVGPDGDVLVVCHATGDVTVCTPATASLVTLPRAGPGATALDAVTACAVAPDGAVVATGDSRGVLRLWDLHRRAPVAETEVGGAVTRCCWASPTRVLTAGATGLNLFAVG